MEDLTLVSGPEDDREDSTSSTQQSHTSRDVVQCRSRPPDET